MEKVSNNPPMVPAKGIKTLYEWLEEIVIALTLVILTLPTVVRTTQESLKTVPQSYREGALGLGATKWYMIRTIILPSSVDGIVTGCILSIGRIVGESAALLFTAGKVIRMAVQQLRQLAEGNDLCKPLGFPFGFW